MLNQSCIPGLIPTWSRFMILFICCYIHFVNILCRKFAAIFIRDIGMWFSYSIFDFLSWFLGSISFSSTLSSVQSVVTDPLPTPWTAACQASQSITNSMNLLKLMCIESVMRSNHTVLCHPLLLLPSIFPTIRVFSNESALARGGQSCTFSFSIDPSNYSNI